MSESEVSKRVRDDGRYARNTNRAFWEDKRNRQKPQKHSVPFPRLSSPKQIPNPAESHKNNSVYSSLQITTKTNHRTLEFSRIFAVSGTRARHFSSARNVVW